jgi:hypothetical protein
MKIKLNVRVNLTKSGKIFTVWARPHAHLPGVEFYTGHGHSTREAIEDLFFNMPDEFRIDDEIIVKTTSLEHELRRPFEIVHSDNVRVFNIA